jgi:hypothetical protein
MSPRGKRDLASVGMRMLTATLRKVGDVPVVRDKGSVVSGFLRPIDTERIARTLNLNKVAAENGRKDLPPSDSDMLDAVEQKIIQPIESEWTWHGGELVNHLRAYATRLIGFSIDAEFEKLQLKANDALARLRTAHHRAEAELGHLQIGYVEARRELELFRKRHRLERPARNPARRWTAFGLLFVLVALESVLNGFFFAKGSEFGLVGGVGTAIGISLCNVAFAFSLGLGPARWINHRNIGVKFCGLLLSNGGVAALLGLHIFATQFRDATAAVGEERAMTFALEKMLRTPWAVVDLSSVYLFGLGVLFGFVALWKGYLFDDPYPSYGSHARRAAHARETYSDEHSELFDDLETIKEDTIQELDNGISRIPLFPQQAAQIRAQKAAILQTFRGYETAVETAANRLLTQYRDENRKYRTTPVPPHFGRRWCLRHSFLESAQVKELTAEPGHQAPDVAAALNELRRLSTEVLREYESLMTRYPHSTQIQ